MGKHTKTSILKDEWIPADEDTEEPPIDEFFKWECERGWG